MERNWNKLFLALAIIMLATCSAFAQQTIVWEYHVYSTAENPHGLGGRFATKDDCERALAADMKGKEWTEGCRCDAFTLRPKLGHPKLGALRGVLPGAPVGIAIDGWEFNAGPGKGNWTLEKNRAEYPTRQECEMALEDAMQHEPKPWPPGIKCSPYRLAQ